MNQIQRKKNKMFNMNQRNLKSFILFIIIRIKLKIKRKEQKKNKLKKAQKINQLKKGQKINQLKEGQKINQLRNNKLMLRLQMKRLSQQKLLKDNENLIPFNFNIYKFEKKQISLEIDLNLLLNFK